MARPLKDGLDYFPLDVDFLRDIKVRKIKRSYGTQSIELLLCLLGNIYRDSGYYLRWDEDSIFLVADEIGAKEGLVEDVVKKAVQVNFFDREKFEKYQILTSKGIQSRYIEATDRRKKTTLIQEYLINVDNNSLSSVVNVDNNSINVDSNTQSKVKESKVNKSKQQLQEKVAAAADEKSNNQSPLNLWQGVYGGLNAIQQEDLLTYQQELGQEIVCEAITRTAKVLTANDRGKAFRYMSQIINSWKSAGVKTMADVKKQDKIFDQSKPAKQTAYSSRPKTKEIATDWSKKEIPKSDVTDEDIQKLINKLYEGEPNAKQSSPNRTINKRR